MARRMRTFPDAVPLTPPPQRSEQMQVTAILTAASEGGYTGLNPETGTTTEGETVEEALESLREAVELYLEEFS